MAAAAGADQVVIATPVTSVTRVKGSPKRTKRRGLGIVSALLSMSRSVAVELNKSRAGTVRLLLNGTMLVGRFCTVMLRVVELVIYFQSPSKCTSTGYTPVTTLATYAAVATPMELVGVERSTPLNLNQTVLPVTFRPSISLRVPVDLKTRSFMAVKLYCVIEVGRIAAVTVAVAGVGTLAR